MLILLAVPDNEDDTALFRRLYDEHCRDMLRYAAYLLRDRHVAEDTVQEAFLRVSQNIRKFYPGVCHNPRGLLVIIVRNLCRSRLRRDGLIGKTSWDKWTGDRPPEAAITYDQTHLELVDLIERLGSDYSDVLKLKYLYGYTFEEIARELGITPEAARTRASRAYKKLRAQLEKDEALHG